MCKQIILYSSPSCPKCKILERKLVEKGIEFKKTYELEEIQARKIYSLPVLQIDEEFLTYAEAYQKIINGERWVKMSNLLLNYKEKYRSYVDFINSYRVASNAASGSQVDSNANVENKNVTTCTGELYKKDAIGINRLLMIEKITELYGEELAEEYIRSLDGHEIYRHDETNPMLPYCVSITMYPFLFDGLTNIGGLSTAPKNLDSFCGSFVNLVFAIASQFAGAVSTPEFLMYMDYFIRKEYGNDYYLKPDSVVSAIGRKRTIHSVIHDKFSQVVYSLNQPAAARNFQSVN